MLPTFLIAGERRSGTTSLYHWLTAHPDVHLYPETDTAYFTESELAGRTTWLDGRVDAAAWEATHSAQDYATRFPPASGAVGEKCADIVFWEPTHDRLRRFVPDARYVVVLRHPTARAWSHYWNEVAKGREDLSFEDALAAEDERAARSDYAKYHLSYGRRGNYDETVPRFVARMGADRVHVVVFEELVADPVGGLKSIYSFLGVDETKGLERAGTRHNENWAMVRRGWAERAPFKRIDERYRRFAKRAIERALRGKEDRQTRKRRALRYAEAIFRKPASDVKMSPETRARLDARFAPHIEGLERSVGRSIPAWRPR